ncbi:hypothetical protein L596_013120 [Steinernema carpocapsae]|uniref:Uncharacterized protein n=1 Tax=Steinernema carpocapsae TaxID=34508 RepID=A0A4U5P022_STECR|nr:hypothetical protein L596_013120 [Steinernema carpocapsae]
MATMQPLWLLLFCSLFSWVQSGPPHKWLNPLHGPDEMARFEGDQLEGHEDQEVLDHQAYEVTLGEPDGSSVVRLKAELTEEQESARTAFTRIEAVLALAEKVYPEAKVLKNAVGYLLSDVIPQPDTPMDKLRQQVTDLSTQVQKGFGNIEMLINKVQFEQDVANPSKKMSEALNSYLNDNGNKKRKQVLFETCVQVSPCTALEIFDTNIFRNNPGYIDKFLNNTEYGHNEIYQLRSYLVNTTTSLMISCTFCEQMIQLELKSMADRNINKARDFANAILVELDDAYHKQQYEYWPTNLKNYLTPYLESTVDKIDDFNDAAQKVCDHIKAKYSIARTDVFRTDNFACIAYGDPCHTEWDSPDWNKYYSSLKDWCHDNLLVIKRGKRAYMIYRQSSSEKDYPLYKNRIEAFKQTMNDLYPTTSQGYIDSKSVTGYTLQKLFDKANFNQNFPAMVFLPVYYKYGCAINGPRNMGYAGIDQPTNGNTNAMVKLSYDGHYDEYFIWKIATYTSPNMFNFFIGL